MNKYLEVDYLNKRKEWIGLVLFVLLAAVPWSWILHQTGVFCLCKLDCILQIPVYVLLSMIPFMGYVFSYRWTAHHEDHSDMLVWIGSFLMFIGFQVTFTLAHFVHVLPVTLGIWWAALFWLQKVSVALYALWHIWLINHKKS